MRLGPKLLADVMLRIWRSDISPGNAIKIYVLLFAALGLIAYGIAAYTGNSTAPIEDAVEQYTEEE